MGPGIVKSKGFTLIEVIVIITLGGLIAAMIVPFIGTAVTRSSEPIVMVEEAFHVNQVMAKLMAEYREQTESGTLDLAVFKSNLSNFEENGVTLSSTYIEFPQSGGAYTDTDGDGIYDPLDKGTLPTDLLLVTAEKNAETLRVILGAGE